MFQFAACLLGGAAATPHIAAQQDMLLSRL